ncbi:Fe-S cluster assembly protein SufD [bacterium]|nr:Fe-S cluster assembly protein SufD [bacterium]
MAASSKPEAANWPWKSKKKAMPGWKKRHLPNRLACRKGRHIMAAIKDKLQTYSSIFDDFMATLPKDEPGWIRQLRRKAIARSDELGFPTTKHEDWRFTNVSSVIEKEFAVPKIPSGNKVNLDLEEYSFEKDDVIQLVFVNGFFSADLSHLCDLPDGARIKNLATAIECNAEYLEPYLSRLGSFDKSAFAALNTGFMRDGAYIHIPANQVVERPIHLLYITTSSDTPIVTYPRNLFVVGNNAQVSIIESYAGTDGDVYFTNGVSEFIVGNNAVLDHYKIQRESRDAYHITDNQIYLEQDANFYTNNVTFGGSITRNDIDAKLDAENIQCTLNGLYMIDGEQHVDNHTLLIHEKPHCESHELYKGILNGQSSGVFRGKIFVQKDAQKTDAKQDSKGLLLSKEAEVNAMPQLEIYADDVKCTHGATTGHLDDDAIFYLQSRGISKENARGLLTYAYASELINRMKLDCVREKLDTLLYDRLSVEV